MYGQEKRGKTKREKINKCKITIVGHMTNESFYQVILVNQC